jgi:hypothetical protein
LLLFHHVPFPPNYLRVFGEVSSTGFAEGITVEEVFAITVVES